MKTWTQTQLNNADKFNLDTKLDYKESLNLRIVALVKEKEGVLISGSYMKNTSPLVIKCKNGHEFTTYWNRFSKGIWCGECSTTYKQSISVAVKEAEKRGGELISTNYVSNKSKLSWKCSKGHAFKTSLDKVKNRNQWCPTCNGNLKPSITEIDEFTSLKNGKALTREYINSQTSMKWECEFRHTWETNWSTIKRGHWCPHCAGLAKVQLSSIKNIIEDKGGELLSNNYENNKVKIKIKCKECKNDWEMRWNNITQGQWCPKCNFNGSSNPEREMVEFIKSITTEGVVIISNDRTICKPYELDVLLPEYNLAVEYHGLYWHSARNPRKEFKKLHERKYSKCKDAGIKLIQIFEDEWRDSKEVIESMIKSRLNLNTTTIFARKCVVKEVGKYEQRVFFNTNHIAKSTPCSVTYGLYYNNELITALSVRKPYTRKYSNHLEIARFASKLNTTVPGGFQKLLKRVEEHAKRGDFTGILTYSDCRFGSGDVYKKAGFEYLGKTKPNYFYEKGGVREGRFKHKKNNDPDFMEKWGHTEREQNNNRGWYEVYDAGSESFVKKIT